MSAEIVKRKLIEAVFRLEISKGHLKWSLTSVARSAKVSRSLVYYHFGNTKQEVLFGCLEAATEEFYGLSDSRKGLSLLESLQRSHAMYEANPAYAIFFQKWRFTPGKVQKIFLAVEARYERRLQETFSKATPSQVRAIHAIFHGLTTAAYLDEAGLRAALGLLGLASIR